MPASTIDPEKTVSSADGPHYDEDFNELANTEEVAETQETEDIEKEKEKVDLDEDLEKDKEDEDQQIEEPVQIPFSRPSVKEIKEKYPNFFKDFPEIKEAMFREALFTQIYPTVDDAKEAFTDNEAFAALSDSALSGDPIPLIESLEKTDTKAFNAFSCAFLPALYKKNQEVYSTVVTPLFENLFRQAYKSGDENMKNSAINLAEYLFGEGEGEASVTGKKTLSRTIQITKEQEDLKKNSDERNAVAFRTAASAVSDQVRKSMNSLVGKDFDPNKVFTPFIRGKLIDEIVQKIDSKLNSAEDHKRVMGGRWKHARANGYSNDEISKLTSTYLARAKSLIPSVREEVRLAALGKTKRVAEEHRARVEKTVVHSEVNGGRSPGSRSTTPAKDYSKMSDMEILNS